VDERERARHPLVVRGRGSSGQLRRREHPLVDERLDEKLGIDEVRPGRQLGDAPDHVELALERVQVAVEAVGGARRRAADTRGEQARVRAGGALVDRDVAPASTTWPSAATVSLEQLLELVRARSSSCGRKHTATP
jgi:hypothetical protein